MIILMKTLNNTHNWNLGYNIKIKFDRNKAENYQVRSAASSVQSKFTQNLRVPLKCFNICRQRQMWEHFNICQHFTICRRQPNDER